MLSSYRSYCSYKYAKSKSGAQLTLMRTIVIQGVVKQKTMFSSAVGHSVAHRSKLSKLQKRLFVFVFFLFQLQKHIVLNEYIN